MSRGIDGNIGSVRVARAIRDVSIDGQSNAKIQALAVVDSKTRRVKANSEKKDAPVKKSADERKEATATRSQHRMGRIKSDKQKQKTAAGNKTRKVKSSSGGNSVPVKKSAAERKETAETKSGHKASRSKVAKRENQKTKNTEGANTETPQELSCRFKDTLMKVRVGEVKLSKAEMRKFCQDAEKLFSIEIDKIKLQAQALGVPEDIFDQEARGLKSLAMEAFRVIKTDKNYGSTRMKAICIDALIEDSSKILSDKFIVKVALERKIPYDELKKIISKDVLERITPKVVTKEIKPSVSVFYEKVENPETKEVTLIPQYRLTAGEAKLKNICLRGGGGKGIGYLGMLEEMGKLGKLDELDSIAGTSAGGIAAVALGFGVKFDEMGKFCDEVQNGVGKKESKATLKAMPFAKEYFTGVGFMGSAAGIISAVDKSTMQQIRNFYKQNSVQKFLGQQEVKHSVLTAEEISRLDKLYYRSENPTEESDLVTFKDLEILRKIRGPGIENNFREITLTGWDATDQTELYFNAENFPDMPIALATRITMALPIVFQKVEIDLSRYTRGQEIPGMSKGKLRMVDGGLASNTPNEIFIKPLTADSTEAEKIAHAKAQQETLTCVFDEGGSSFERESFGHVKTGDNLGIRILNFFLSLFGLMKRQKQKQYNENEKLDGTGNTYVVAHGDLGTMSMNPNSEAKDAVTIMSKLMAAEWSRQHEGVPLIAESKDLSALLMDFSIEELLQFDSLEPSGQERKGDSADVIAHNEKIHAADKEAGNAFIEVRNAAILEKFESRFGFKIKDVRGDELRKAIDSMGDKFREQLSQIPEIKDRISKMDSSIDLAEDKMEAAHVTTEGTDLKLGKFEDKASNQSFQDRLKFFQDRL